MTRRQYLALKKKLDQIESDLAKVMRACRSNAQEDIYQDLRTAADNISDAKGNLIADMEEGNE